MTSAAEISGKLADPARIEGAALLKV